MVLNTGFNQRRSKMSDILFLATSRGLVACQRQDATWVEQYRGLIDQPITSVIVSQGAVIAGTRNGIYRSDDLGQSWHQTSEGLTVKHIRWLAYHPDIPGHEFAGTEPAAIFLSKDGGQTWQERLEVADLRREFGWSLPYSPEAGCVRGFAFHGQRGYAAVEVGGVLVSDDGGETWGQVEGSRGRPTLSPGRDFVHSDVHSIVVHPTSPGLVVAPTGGGLYRSSDGGITWEHIYPACYCRAVWLDPLNPDHMVLGPADGVDRNGRIERTMDGGRTWLPASDGLQVPWGHHMVERFLQLEGELLAVLSNGQLLAAPLEELHWVRILPEVQGVVAVAGMQA
jgi:photosystem II stability/assembly factor-like uncharacterized protein